MSKKAEDILNRLEAKAKAITEKDPIVLAIGAFLVLAALMFAARWPGLAILGMGILLVYTIEKEVIPALKRIADTADRQIAALERQAAAMEKMAAEGDKDRTAAEILDELAKK